VLTLSRPESGPWWKLPNVVFGTYTLFLAGFYFVPNAVDLYKFYIVAVFLPGLFLIPKVLKQTRGSIIWLGLTTYLGYMLLSSLWSSDFSIELLWRDFRYVLYILSFILLTLYFFSRNRELPEAVLQRVSLVVFLAAAVSILIFEPIYQLTALGEERLVGVGTTQNPNPSAFIYGFFGVISLDYVLQNRKSRWAYVYAAGAVIIALFVILTQSNTSLLALTTACALLFLVEHRTARRTLVAGLLFLLVAGIYLAWSLGAFNADIDIGFTKRWPIWQHTLELWRDAPFFGQGFQMEVLLTEDGQPSELNYAHSTFLATLRDGGLTGLALLSLVYICAFRTAVRIALVHGRALYLSLFVFGLLCVLVDTDQIITRPRELWIILWLPLSCLIAYESGIAGDTPPGSVNSVASPDLQRAAT
jgi:O-antigen ligase